MAKENAEALLKRAEKAFSDRDANKNLFIDCYELYSPYRNTLTVQGPSFNAPTRQYDSTGQISTANFVNTIQREFTPPFTIWSMLKAGPGVPERDRPALNKQLEVITETFFAYLNSSNFITAAPQMYWEWGMGTGALWFHEGDQQQPFNFVASPISEMGINEGKYATVDFRCRRYKCKQGLLKTMWPQATLPEGMDITSDAGKEKETEVTECFYYDYELFLWHYDVIVEKKSIYDADHLEEICFTPRWLRIPGFPYGVGPMIMALADVKTLNKLKEFLLRSAALDVAGVYTIASDGAVNPNTVNIAPNTFIPVERNSGENGPTIDRLDTTTNFQLQEYIANGLQEQIRKTLLDNRLPAETPQPKTAFEIAARMREFQTDIGSAYGNGFFEFVQPLWKRGLSILMKKGLIQLPEGFTVDNFFVQVHVISPIAQTQQAEQVQKMMQEVEMMAAINPNLVLSRYKVEEFPKWLTEMMGTPAKLLRDEAEAVEMEKAAMQMAATQATEAAA